MYITVHSVRRMLSKSLTHVQSRTRNTDVLRPTPFNRDRYLLHPTEGMGITDEAIRRRILEAVDALEE